MSTSLSATPEVWQLKYSNLLPRSTSTRLCESEILDTRSTFNSEIDTSLSQTARIVPGSSWMLSRYKVWSSTLRTNLIAWKSVGLGSKTTTTRGTSRRDLSVKRFGMMMTNKDMAGMSR